MPWNIVDKFKACFVTFLFQFLKHKKSKIKGEDVLTIPQLFSYKKIKIKNKSVIKQVFSFLNHFMNNNIRYQCIYFLNKNRDLN